VPPQIIWLTELVIYSLFIKALLSRLLRGEKFFLKFHNFVFIFFAISVISYVINAFSIVHMFLFLRLMLRYYLLFLAVINLNFNDKTISFINKAIVFLFIIQIPTAAIKLFIFGQGERAIGTYGYHGGGNSTAIPMIAISFLMALFFYYKPSRLYVLLSIGFVAFGIMGGKRAIVFFLPILLFFIGAFLLKDKRIGLKYLFVGSLFIIVLGYSCLRLIPTLNPQRQIGGEFNLAHLKSFALNYTTRMNADRSAGRLATTMNVFKILKDEGFLNVMFGFGPGSYIETMFKDLKNTLKEKGSLPIVYGVTGLSWLALQIGYPGTIIYLFLFLAMMIASLKFSSRESRKYWKAFNFGMFGFSFVMVFLSIFYSPVFGSDLIPLIYFLLAAFMITQSQKQKTEQVYE